MSRGGVSIRNRKERRLTARNKVELRQNLREELFNRLVAVSYVYDKARNAMRWEIIFNRARSQRSIEEWLADWRAVERVRARDRRAA